MICLRCGYCCKALFVAIADDPDKGFVPDNIILYNGDSKCKYLVGDKEGEYSCAVHGKEWYSDTPCFQYTQIEDSPNDKCRIGAAIIDRKKN